MDYQGAARRQPPPWALPGGDPGEGEGETTPGTSPWPSSHTGSWPAPSWPPPHTGRWPAAPGGAGGYGAGGYETEGSDDWPLPGPRTAARRLTGPAPVLTRGTGGQPTLGAGSGPQAVLGLPDAAGFRERTPTGGFRPARESADPLLTGPIPAGPPPTGPIPAGPAPTGPMPAETAGPGRRARPGEDPRYLNAEDGDGGGNGVFTDGTFVLSAVKPDQAAQGRAAPGGRRRAGRRPRRRGRFRAALAAVTVAVAGLGFAGYKLFYQPRVDAPVPPTLRLPTSAASSPGFDEALGKWQHIGSRAQDPQPLTVAGLYPPAFDLNGSSYTRTAASVTKNCSLAVYGPNLQAALQSGKCTQVVRASYLSGNGAMMGTIGVVNLVSSSAAQKAGKVTGPQEIIAPLSAKKGPTAKLGKGTGVVQAEIKGHYLILTWAEFTSLKSPSGQAQRQALEQFAANLVTGSANINLSTRMLTGKP